MYMTSCTSETRKEKEDSKDSHFQSNLGARDARLPGIRMVRINLTQEVGWRKGNAERDKEPIRFRDQKEKKSLQTDPGLSSLKT